jgi:hypothetical protein
MEWITCSETLSKFVPNTEPVIVGIKRGDLTLRKISRQVCNNLIIKNHYSHKTATDAHTKLHLGIFYKDILVGGMQFGYAMNPRSCENIVKDTKIDEYYELNRLWISDDVPIKNVESQVIGMSFKLIKNLNPKIKWIQSFADGRVGCGTIYQATNFLFCGSHKREFVQFGGETHHIGKFHNYKKSFGRLYRGLQDTLPKQEFDQYRYIYFLDKTQRKNLLLEVLPYPKINKPQ